ncbi:MAG: VWA domain-containing protein [Chloroflexi bacterium]|nr:VWA domain-containing protein [Chloroflexota bacterium]
MRTRLGLGARTTVTLMLAFLLSAVVGGLGSLPAEAQARSNCVAQPDKVAAPSEIELGETVQVTLTLTDSCPQEVSPVDVMLVIDGSESMLDDQKIVNAKAAAKAFLDAMDLGQSRVGLVVFNEVAGLYSGLTQDEAYIRTRIDTITPSGRTNISAAIDLAAQELRQQDRGLARAMIVLTDGINTVPTDPVPVAAQRAKDEGVILVTICAGGQCDPGLPSAASSPDLFFDVPDASQLTELYRSLAGELQANAIVEWTIRDVVPANMKYIDGSAVPTPDDVSREPNGETVLTWRLSGVFPPAGLSYRLEPLETGLHPTNVVATGDFKDRRGLPGDVRFPVPRVLVRSECPPKPLEIFVLIDDSNCLAGATLNEMDSKSAIRKGVEKVLDQIALGKDTVAVIGYGDTAEIFTPLSSDRDEILAGVDRVTMRDGSARLDLAYLKVAEELKSVRHREGVQVLTHNITDGPMMQAPELARARATALKSAYGARHYHIAVGTIAQYALLRQIAEPGGFWTIPFGGDVITPYTEFGAISAAFGFPAACPGGPTPNPTSRPTRDLPTPTSGPGRQFFGFLPRLFRRE